MTHARLWLVALSLVAVALAGCSGSDDPAPADDEFGDLELEATDDTGIIRGVIVDDAIRPIAGASVMIDVGDETVTAITAEDGLFGFDELDPGSYTVRASKLGFFEAQQTTEVVAGVTDPPALRILLMIDVENMPYATQYVFDGFIECGFTSPAVGVSLCGVVNIVAGPGATNEESQARFPFDRAPTFIQSEMMWDSTQAAGDELALMYSYGECGNFYCDHDVRGASPLILMANETVSERLFLDEGELYMRVFTDDLDDTAAPCAPDPRDDTPICPSGAGVTFEQSFRIITHVFYGYAPPEGWLYIADGEAPPPS